MNSELRAIRSAIEEPPDSEVGILRLRRARARLSRSHRALESRGDPGAVQVLLALDPVMVLDAPFEHYAALLEAATRRASELPPTVHAALLRSVARFWTLRGAQRVASRAIAAAGDVLAGARDETPLHAGLRIFVSVHASWASGPLEDLERATTDLETIAASPDRHGARLRALATTARGMFELTRCRPERSLDPFAAAIDAARSARADRTLAIALANQGAAFAAIDAPDRAAVCFGKSLGMFRSLRDRVHTALLRSHLLVLSAARGRFPPPDAVLACIRAHERVGDHWSAARLLLFLVAGAEAGLVRRRAAPWLARAWASLARVDAPELEARARELTGRVEPAQARGRPTLEVSADCTLARFGLRELDLRSRKALPRVLSTLVAARLERPGARLDVPALFAAGWPDEKAAVHAAAARVYMAIRALRAAGLGPAITTTADGYRIEPDVIVHPRALGFRRI